jgi:chemotaxis protein methyltransferase CheR
MNAGLFSAAQTKILNQPDPLTEIQFKRIAGFVESNVGIKMPGSKRIMMQSRLLSRLKALRFNNFDDYIGFVFSSDPAAHDETILMINAITTNLTNFFRENQHFEYMTQYALPELAAAGITSPKIWSAGCSSGEEPYTLSITMQEYMRAHPGQLSNFSILATDISSKVLGKAVEAVYPMDSIAALSFDLKHRYFLRSRSEKNQRARVNAATRQTVSFARLNFMDDDYNLPALQNIIFCRNVLIYFDKQTQESVVRKITKNLAPGGFLFLGHSETIFGMNLPLKNAAPTIFRKIDKCGVNKCS